MIKNKIYFASDFHLGTPSFAESRLREERIIKWLKFIENDAHSIYLVGDLFDFWYEYKTVIPKGYIRFLGKLADLKDKGIEIYVFTGNHDMWMFDYFKKELNIPVFKRPIEINLNGYNFYVGHGDGLGPGDHSYKFLKKVFSNKFCVWLFGWLHPDIGIKLANFWSKRSRIATGTTNDQFLGENEWLVNFCKEKLKQQPNINYFIFGHRHLPISQPIEHAHYINLGDWIKYNSYAVFDGNNLELKVFHD